MLSLAENGFVKGSEMMNSWIFIAGRCTDGETIQRLHNEPTYMSYLMCWLAGGI